MNHQVKYELDVKYNPTSFKIRMKIAELLIRLAAYVGRFTIDVSVKQTK